MSTRLTIANEFSLGEVDGWWIIAESHRPKIVPTRLTASMTVPGGANPKDAIKVPFTGNAKAIQYFVLEWLSEVAQEGL